MVSGCEKYHPDVSKTETTGISELPPPGAPPHHFVARLVVNKDHLSAIGSPDVTGQHGRKIRMIPWDSPKKNGDRRCPSSSMDDELPRLIIDAWKNPYLQYKMVPQFVS